MMLSRLWKDTMDIYRYEESELDNMTVNTEVLKYSNIKCHYSKGNLTDTGTDGVPTLVNTHSLFCSLETDLQEGDKVIVTQKNSRRVTLSVGEGFPYTYHQEFKVKRDDKV